MEAVTVGNTMKFKITSEFGAKESFRNNPHTGIDINFPNGTELQSIADGVVENVVYNHDSIGNAVFVKFSDDTTGIYAHMSSISVEKGQLIQKGDLLGLSGNTGNVVGQNGGYHLHFALKDGSTGEYINPTHYADDLISMTNKDMGIGEKLLQGYNDFADKVIESEVNFILKPIGEAIANGTNELLTMFTLYLPDMFMIVTVLTGLLICLGIKLPKTLTFYTFGLVGAVAWLANANS
ncbi:M23 family metallopeptidase [Sutcliffiella sp. NC1]|uniref:M23 family metallopeptidase n=1 Tax=Sutcliffiella sp. NC1 TaxID=3004096 RepID=UPI0022DE624F|nr:M23 family metallopeptidase [Sutcliffiella sp. NC1]WBL16389.1 M23 family metallopeptidase [Sutcliffiella sp. NC1]